METFLLFVVSGRVVRSMELVFVSSVLPSENRIANPTHRVPGSRLSEG